MARASIALTQRKNSTWVPPSGEPGKDPVMTADRDRGRQTSVNARSVCYKYMICDRGNKRADASAAWGLDSHGLDSAREVGLAPKRNKAQLDAITEATPHTMWCVHAAVSRVIDARLYADRESEQSPNTHAKTACKESLGRVQHTTVMTRAAELRCARL